MDIKEKCEKLISFMNDHKITPTDVKILAKIDDRDRCIISGTDEKGFQYKILMKSCIGKKTHLRIVNKF